jgi:hypothetical protein
MSISDRKHAPKSKPPSRMPLRPKPSTLRPPLKTTAVEAAAPGKSADTSAPCSNGQSIPTPGAPTKESPGSIAPMVPPTNAKIPTDSSAGAGSSVGSETGTTGAETAVTAPAIPFHPFAEIFPMLAGERLRELAQDIKEHGLLDPVVLYEGKILDGRCRYVACGVAGIEPKLVEYDGGDPLGFVIGKNLRRRHLTESQRAMVAAKLADLPVGANQYTAGTPIGAGAQLFNVSKRSIDRAREVLRTGNPELVEAVESGKLRVSAAAKRGHAPAASGVQSTPDSANDNGKEGIGSDSLETGTLALTTDGAVTAASLPETMQLQSAQSGVDDLDLPPRIDRRPLSPDDQHMLDGLLSKWIPKLQEDLAPAPVIVRERFAAEVVGLARAVPAHSPLAS